MLTRRSAKRAVRFGFVGGGAKVYALDRLLPERFGGKVGRGLAVESSRRREHLGRAASLFAPILTVYTKGSETRLETGDNGPKCKLMFVVERKECILRHDKANRPERRVIDRALGMGQASRSVVRRYAELNREAVQKHRDERHNGTRSNDGRAA